MHRLAALVLASLWLLPALRAAEEPLTPVNFSGEPIGSEYPIARGLASDAEDLTGADKTLAAPDVEATTLQKGLIVRAFAEALTTAESPDAVVRARSAARRALILARLGTVNFAAELANEALAEPVARGEVMLARTWMFWHAGNLAYADREAARATGAPAWALAEWQAHRAQYAPALAKFRAAPEPEDPYSPAFLAHAELALAARVFYLADGLYFRATNNLQQQFNAEKNFPPTNLQRARRGLRDLVRTMLGEVAREPGARRLSAVVLATAREVCATPAARADWETYLKLVLEIRSAQPTFDFAYYDLHTALQRAEKEAGLDLAWREKLKPLLHDPRQRFASRVHQALARLEAHAGWTLLTEPLDTTYSTEQLATLKSYGELLEAEDTVIAQLHKTLPAGTDSVPRDAEYVVAAAKLRFRLALIARDATAARTQFAKIEQLPDIDYTVSLPAYRDALTQLEQGPFDEAYAALLTHPPARVPRDELDRVLDAAEDIDFQLVERHGEDYAAKETLPPADVALLQRIYYVRIVDLLSTGQTLAAESALGALRTWCAPKQHPAFAPLDAIARAVADAPEQNDGFSAEEKTIFAALKADQPDPAFPARLRQLSEEQPNRWTPRLLLPIAHWRLSQDDLAAQAVAAALERVPTNQASRKTLATLAAQNDPEKIIRNHVAAIAAAPAAERPKQVNLLVASANSLIARLGRNFCAGKSIELAKLPPDARRAYAFCMAGYVHSRVARGRLSNAVELLGSLEEMKFTDAAAFARPAVENAPFTHDLPDETSRALWRRLLENAPQSSDAFNQILVQLEPAYKAGSITAGMSSVFVPFSTGNIRQARSNLAMLERLYGRNHAIAAQLEQLNHLLVFGTDDIGLDFGNANEERIKQLAERRRELEREAQAFRDANYDRLAESYYYDRYTIERGMLEKILHQIDAVSSEIKAVADREQASRDHKQRKHNEVRAEVCAALRRLMAL